MARDLKRKPYTRPYISPPAVTSRAIKKSIKIPTFTCNWANTRGLFEAFQRALSYLELDQQPSKLIGFGCDGANVNMGSKDLFSLTGHGLFLSGALHIGLN